MRGIYVEIVIQADMDELWRRTQDPLLHQQWDLRFSQINYLPRASDAEPPRFLYATRIGFGFDIEGRGESTGTRSGDRASNVGAEVLVGRRQELDPRRIGLLAVSPGRRWRPLPYLVRLRNAIRCARPYLRSFRFPPVDARTGGSRLAFGGLPVSSVQPSDVESRHDRLVGHRLAGVRPIAIGHAMLAPSAEGDSMRSIYQRALGSEFARLHPEIQRRFGVSARDGMASIGTGVMEEVRWW